MEVSSVGSSHLRLRRRLFLIFSCIILTIGQCGGPLLTRLYFLHGGKRVWFSSWLQTVSFPVTFIPLAAAYFQRRKAQGPAAKLTFLTPKIFLAAAFIGLLMGIDGYMNALGVSKLPVSTSSLLLATQLAFTAAFAFLLVRQRFTPFSVNAIVLLTSAAAILAIGADGDKPAGESTKDYILGFVLTLLAAALYGFFLPLIEYTYKMAKEGMTYTFVLELQCVMSFFATAFCTVGMLVNKDFQKKKRRCVPVISFLFQINAGKPAKGKKHRPSSSRPPSSDEEQQQPSSSRSHHRRRPYGEENAKEERKQQRFAGKPSTALTTAAMAGNPATSQPTAPVFFMR